MNEIYAKFFKFLEIGDNCPTIIIGVLNLSPESFYKGSVYDNAKKIELATKNMISNGAAILDLGARSTAPWSEKITIEEEINRMESAMNTVCKIIPDNIILSIDTQYRRVAQRALEISAKFKKKIIVNDVSCLKTDPGLGDFVAENDLPIVLMASKEVPGDLLTTDEIRHELNKTIEILESKGYDGKKIIIDPGIGRWVDKKTPEFDLKIIGNLDKLRSLNKPILVAISRKSFIGATLHITEPEKRLNGTLSATAIAIYKGAHIIRTHDVNQQLTEIIKIAEEIRKNE
ncbi:MAG TPA: dihydropteroate synthase [Candidatus Nanopelagicaceae bacterium]|nr:dihydropteroate synthase [Candidatus Nanopelagicaceae bacterium]